MSTDIPQTTDLSVLKDAFRLLRDAQLACGKLGLWGKGSAALPHEVRMFAQAFSIEGDTESKAVMRRLNELHEHLNSQSPPNPKPPRPPHP